MAKTSELLIVELRSGMLGRVSFELPADIVIPTVEVAVDGDAAVE
jgi:hypothetical protein